MERYKKTDRVRINLLESKNITSFGAFVKDGTVRPGWTGANQRVLPVGNLIAMSDSAVGNSIIALASSGEVYSAPRDDGTALEVCRTDGGDTGFIFDTNDGGGQAVAISGNKYTYFAPGGSTQGDFEGGLASGVIKSGRLFGGDRAERRRIKWSGEGGWQDWAESVSGAGSMLLEPVAGAVCSLFDFDGDLVIFCENAVVRMAVGGNPENFKVTGCLKIPCLVENTAAEAGESIFFVTESGFMRYNGGGVEKLEGLITDDLTAPGRCYVYKNRYYFISGESRALGRRVIYVYDVLDDAYQLVDVSAYFINADDISVLAFTNSTIYRLTFADTAREYAVTVSGINFGTLRRKLLLCLETDCDGDVSVSISNGRSTRRVGAPAIKTRLNMRGAQFGVTFNGKDGGVRSAYLTAEVEK